MKTKEEIIQEAYGEYWEKVKDFVDEWGWLDVDKFYLISEAKMNFSQIETKEGLLLFDNHRPISLKGIENNNGWILFNYEKLPKDIDCHVFTRNADMIVLSSNVINSISKNSLANITHYRAIEKPKPPIY